jgi:hypothetical protein
MRPDRNHAADGQLLSPRVELCERVCVGVGGVHQNELGRTGQRRNRRLCHAGIGRVALAHHDVIPQPGVANPALCALARRGVDLHCKQTRAGVHRAQREPQQQCRVSGVVAEFDHASNAVAGHQRGDETHGRDVDLGRAPVPAGLREPACQDTPLTAIEIAV